MKKIALVTAVLLTLGASSGVAEARPGGCLKYGLGGAVAGHVAGGHRWKGAAIGCVLGIYQRRRHLARSRELERSRTADRNRYDDRRPPITRDRARPYDRNETGSIGGGFERGGAFIRGGS